MGADASRYSADHRGNAHGTPANLDHLDTESLYSLMDGYETDLQDLQKPNRSDYDSYDATSLVQFRDDYNSYDKARSEMQATIRKIKNAITLKEQGQPNGPGHSAPASPPPAPAPSPAPGRGQPGLNPWAAIFRLGRPAAPAVPPDERQGFQPEVRPALPHAPPT